MSHPVISVENLSKSYRLGQIGTGTLTDDLKVWWAIKRGQPNPLLKIGEEDHGNREGEIIWALKDVNFTVEQGEVLGIIGRNGAGKSTLLKVLSRVTAPTSGQAKVKGRIASLLEVGTGFHPDLTGRENIYLNGAILGMAKEEVRRKFNEIVDFSGVEKFIDTPVKRYSSGMYVRLAFAVAAHLEPEILVIDEVLAVGDAAFQKKCLGKMGEVAQEGRTVLFVSHNLIALRSLCPRAIWLDHGELQEDSYSSDVIADYLKLQAAKVYGQKWDDPAEAPGNETVRLHRVWVEPEDGSSDAGISREASVSIGVEYWHLDPTAQLSVTLHIYVEQQIIAFTTGSSQDPRWQKLSRCQGLLRSVCRIPAHFLNTGQHRVKMLIVQDLSRVIYTLEDALSFDVVETAQRTGAWYGKEPGVLSPHLPWTTEYLRNGA